MAAIGSGQPDRLVWAIMLACLGPQLWAMLMPQQMASLLFDYGALWPARVVIWRQGLPFSLTMFVTYAFLHTGWLHYAGNMLALWLLGRALAPWLGQRLFGLVYLLSVLGGAAAYFWLADVAQPVIGASAGLFGLAAATIWLKRRNKDPEAAIWTGVVALAFLGSTFGLTGPVAWQAHAGGFIAGLLTIMVLSPRHMRYTTQD